MKIITNEKGSGHTKQHCNQLQHKRLGKRHRSEFTVMLSGTSPNHCRQQTIEDKTDLFRTHWAKSIRLREKIRGVSWMDGSSQELTKKIQEKHRRIIWWNTSYIIKRHGVYDTASQRKTDDDNEQRPRWRGHVVPRGRREDESIKKKDREKNKKKKCSPNSNKRRDDREDAPSHHIRSKKQKDIELIILANRASVRESEVARSARQTPIKIIRHTRSEKNNNNCHRRSKKKIDAT